MDKVLNKIRVESDKLMKSDLCRWLSSENSVGEDRFAFTPSMLFFVLGFRDILLTMRVDYPKTQLEAEINAHCAEDLDHWHWYLHELETLGFIPQSWGTQLGDIFRQIWSADAYVARDLVYSIIHYVRHYDNPLVSLVIVEQLEAAFAVFIKNMGVPIHNAGLYEELEYFGKNHEEKEMAHARGSWVDNERANAEVAFKGIKMDDETWHTAEAIIDDISGRFQMMFDYWYKSRAQFVRFTGEAAQAVEPQHQKGAGSTETFFGTMQ